MSNNRQYAFPRKLGKLGKQLVPVTDATYSATQAQALNAFVEFKESYERKRISSQVAFMAGIRYAERRSADVLEDSNRLDWVINHPDAEFDVDDQRLSLSCYVVANLTSGDEHAHGVSGHFITWGNTHRECIDEFLRGNAKRID